MTATNFRATAPKHNLRHLDVLCREALRTRIMKDHDPWSESEPVKISASKLPAAETGMTSNIQYEGDGRIPEDILGHPKTA